MLVLAPKNSTKLLVFPGANNWSLVEFVLLIPLARQFFSSSFGLRYSLLQVYWFHTVTIVLARGILFGNVCALPIVDCHEGLVPLFLLDTGYFPFCVGVVPSGPAPAPSSNVIVVLELCCHILRGSYVFNHVQRVFEQA